MVSIFLDIRGFRHSALSMLMKSSVIPIYQLSLRRTKVRLHLSLLISPNGMKFLKLCQCTRISFVCSMVIVLLVTSSNTKKKSNHSRILEAESQEMLTSTTD